MITSLTVSNYRSIGANVVLKPSRLSVLIGPNGAGKSNILDVLSFVRDAVLQGLPAAITHRGGIDSVRRRGHKSPFDVRIQLEMYLSRGLATYGFVITGAKQEEYRVKSEAATVSIDDETHRFKRDYDRWQGPSGLAPRMDEQSLALSALGGDERFKGLVDFLSQLTVYSIFPDMLRKPQEFDSVRPMKRHGENWVSILRDMVRDETRKEQLIKGLARLTGDIEDARVTSAAGYLVAEFKQRSQFSKRKQWFSTAHQSDGTLRVAGLLTALLQSPAMPVIGVEEPELTVHPGALPLLYDYLRQASEQSQVLLTTHSPVMLDVIDVESEAVFVVERQNGVTNIKRAETEQLEPVRDQLLSLGELFLSGDLQLTLFPPTAG